MEVCIFVVKVSNVTKRADFGGLTLMGLISANDRF
jgi:hypothetical protein